MKLRHITVVLAVVLFFVANTFAFGKGSLNVERVVMKNNVADSDSVVCADTAEVKEIILEWPESMTHGIDKLLENNMFERSQVGIMVYDLDGDSVMYEYNGRQLMRPASVMKLFTACAALDNLGDDYLFQTELYYKGEICDSVLHGDIYIKGGFDPLFGTDDMYSFVSKMKQKGIFSIDGNIYADVSLKDTLKWGEGWCWDDKEVSLTPLIYEGRDVFMPNFMKFLTNQCVKHPLNYGLNHISSNDVVLIDRRSHTIDQMMGQMMKASDNLYAESLFYQLGAAKSNPYAATKKSADKVYELIGRLGLNPAEYTVADGSGLSLYNYLTPQSVVWLLKYAFKRNNIFNHLYPTLPVSGVDGTLKNRMKDSPAYGLIHAKTGTLRKVSTLAGYTKSPNGTNLAFCIFNQGILNSAEGRDFQDRVCELLVK